MSRSQVVFVVRFVFIEWNIWVKIPMSKQAVLKDKCMQQAMRQTNAETATAITAMIAAEALKESFSNRARSILEAA